MKNWIVISFFLVMTSSVTFAQTTIPQTPTKEKATAESSEKAKPSTDEFNTLIADYYKAWNTLNLDMPSKYYAKDPSLVFFDIAPMEYKGWKEYQSGVRKLLEGYSAFKLMPNKDLLVTRKGKIAWTTLTFHISGKMKDGTALEVDGRHTAIWEKRKSNWLIVHEHVSVPLPAAPAPK